MVRFLVACLLAMSLLHPRPAAALRILGSTVSGGGTTEVALIIEEEDGTPSGTVSTLKVSNTTLTDEGGGVFTLTVGGGGFVTVSGTPTAGQLAIFTDADTIEGTSSLSLNITTLDLSAATATTPNRVGAAPPGTCTVGQTFFDNNATAGSNLFGCTATDTWTVLGGAGSGVALGDAPTWTGTHTFAKTAATGTVAPGIVLTGGAHTALTASTERFDVQWNSARTVEWATGALALQRFHVWQAPTIGFVGASTVTSTCTVCVSGPPVKGTNATLTATHGILVEAGAVSTATTGYGLTVNAPTGATTNYAANFVGSTVVTSAAAAAFAVGPNGATTPTLQVKSDAASAITGLLITASASGSGVTLATTGSAAEQFNIRATGHNVIIDASAAAATIQLRINGTARATIGEKVSTFTPIARTSGVLSAWTFTGAADLALTAGTEAKDFVIDLAQTKQHASNTTIALQRHVHLIPPTDTCASATCTITEDTLFALTGPPTGGTNSTITRASALLIETRALTNVTNGYGMIVDAPSGAGTLNAAAYFRSGPVLIEDLKTSASGAGKKVVCVDTATGQLYVSATALDCS